MIFKVVQNKHFTHADVYEELLIKIIDVVRFLDGLVQIKVEMFEYLVWGDILYKIQVEVPE